MSPELVSYAIGALTHHNVFLGVIISMRLADGSCLHTGWSFHETATLIRGLDEYKAYLKLKEIEVDQEKAAQTLQRLEPHLDQEEISSTTPEQTVERAGFHVLADHRLQLKLEFVEQKSEVAVTPGLALCLSDSVADILNEFDDNGLIIVPEGSIH